MFNRKTRYYFNFKQPTPDGGRDNITGQIGLQEELLGPKSVHLIPKANCEVKFVNNVLSTIFKQKSDTTESIYKCENT